MTYDELTDAVADVQSLEEHIALHRKYYGCDESHENKRPMRVFHYSFPKKPDEELGFTDVYDAVCHNCYRSKDLFE